MDWIAEQFPRTVNGYEIGLWALGYAAWRVLTAPRSARRVVRMRRLPADMAASRQTRRIAAVTGGARWADRGEVLAKTRRTLPERVAAERTLRRAA